MREPHKKYDNSRVVGEIGAAHHGLLASKLAKKASTIRGAIKFAGSKDQPPQLIKKFSAADAAGQEDAESHVF